MRKTVQMIKLFCFVFSLLVFLASCGQHTHLESAWQGNLVVWVENFSTTTLKTIAPSQITLTALQNAGQYKLRLSGTSGRMTLPEQDLSFTNGRATLPNIQAGLWELTLSAYTVNGNIKVLEGKATVDVRPVGANEVYFVLMPCSTGTGTLNLTLTFDPQDRTILSGGNARNIQVTLTNKVTNAVAHTGRYTDVLAQYTYNAGGGQIPAGEYELQLALSGGSIPAGTAARWSDNLYIEPGQETRATITVPQLIIKPVVPQIFTSIARNDAANFTNDFTWQPSYNADSYELEIKSFTGGEWNAATEAKWNGLSGGTVYNYKYKRLYPAGGPAVINGELLKGEELLSTVVGKANSNAANYVARLRSVNQYGTSAWTYLPHIIMPRPTINSLSITKLGQGVNRRNTEFDVTFNITEVDRNRWGVAGYRIEWFRLDNVRNHYQCTLAEAFEKVNTDEEWDAELAAGRKMGGERDYLYVGAATGRQAGPSMLLWGLQNAGFCLRIRAFISGKGYTEWVYYPSLVQAAP